MEPFLSPALVNAANQAVDNAQTELNQFLDCLRKVVLLNGNAREEATCEANLQLQRAFLCFRRDLDQIAKLLPMPQPHETVPAQNVSMIFNNPVTGLGVILVILKSSQ
jgi:hypothetical protein